jgi:glucose/mannose-6-phosphate isomerase
MKYQKEVLSTFSNQIKDRLDNYFPHNLNYRDFNNVVICGLGGSGIGGRIAKSYFSDKALLPIEIVSSYLLPQYVNKESLVILGSYSGNTEETLSMVKEAISKKAKIIILTSGGELMELGKKHDWPIYKAKTGLQPRMALGYSLTNLMLVLSEFFEISTKNKLFDSALKLDDFETYVKKGRYLFSKTNTTSGSNFVIISDDKFEPIATRFAQQIQENAKLEAFVNLLPEANHNVIETYYSKLPAVFFFLDSKSNKRTTQRFDFVRNLLEENGNTVVEIMPSGDGLSQWLETIFILDWTSLWMADSLERESSRIPNISALKQFLLEN